MSSKERRLEIASFLFLLLISNLQSLRVNLQSLRDCPESLRVNLQSLRDSPEGAWGRDSPKPLRLFCRW